MAVGAQLIIIRKVIKSCGIMASNLAPIIPLKTPPKVEIIYQRQLYPQKTRRNENIFRGRQNYRQKYRHFQNSKFEIRMFANRITVA